MPMELLILGSGTSAGVPMIGCDCAVCRSDDPRDARSRASVIVSYPDATSPDGRRRFLIDTAPELRLQMVRHGISRLDGVIFTHAHADHILGVDDLRRFNAVMRSHLNIFADARTTVILQEMFRYIFEPHNNVNQSFVATLRPHVLHAGATFELYGARWTPLALMHGKLPILGFRVDWSGDHGPASLAYCTDVSAVPDETLPLLEGVDVLVLDALRFSPHPTHLSIEQALAVVDRVKPRQTYFTHIAHDVSHAEVDATLPKGVNLAYDGLLVKIG